MSKHTPGPWAIPHLATDGQCNCGSVLSEHQRGMGAIATVHWEGAPGHGKYASEYEELETAKANARLIASAPDLLEALEKLVAVQNELYSDNRLKPTTSWMAAMARSRDALARAKGETVVEAERIFLPGGLG